MGVADIPATLNELAEGAVKPTAAWAGQNDTGQTGYLGACPSAGQIHRYDITVHALSVEHIGDTLPADASPALVTFAVRGKSLGSATLTANAGTGTLGGGTPEATPAGFVLSSSDAANGSFANPHFAPTAAGLGCDGGNCRPNSAGAAHRPVRRASP